MLLYTLVRFPDSIVRGKLSIQRVWEPSYGEQKCARACWRECSKTRSSTQLVEQGYPTCTQTPPRH